MPVEIRELVIKAYVEDSQGGGSADGSASGSGGSADKEEIIADCLEQVSQMLKEKLER